jgi:hypothetical protein
MGKRSSENSFWTLLDKMQFPLKECKNATSALPAFSILPHDVPHRLQNSKNVTASSQKCFLFHLPRACTPLGALPEKTCGLPFSIGNDSGKWDVSCFLFTFEAIDSHRLCVLF